MPLAAAIVLVAASPAESHVRYLGTRSVGAGTVGLSIYTDGKIGPLAASDIVTWTITLSDPTSAFPLRVLTDDGAGGTQHSSVVTGGPAVTATSIALSFTFGLGDLEFNADYTIRPFYQIVSSQCSADRYGDAGACEQFDTGSDYSSQHVQYSLHPASDTVVLATAATPSAVPEPAAWAMMVVGFGLVGRMQRVRKRVVA